jgi:26S proteasome regulatory subunit N8
LQLSLCTITLIFNLLMKVSSKLAALKGLDARLREIRGYLDLVIEGTLPLNHEILYHLQVWLSIAICYMQCYSLIRGE